MRVTKLSILFHAKDIMIEAQKRLFFYFGGGAPGDFLFAAINSEYGLSLPC